MSYTLMTSFETENLYYLFSTAIILLLENMGVFVQLKERLKNQTPRWIVFLIDLHFTALALAVSIGIVWQSEWNIGLKNSTTIAIIAIVVYPLSFLFFKTFKRVIRHTGLRDVVNVLEASSSALVMLLTALLVLDVPYPKQSFILVVLHYLLTVSSLIFIRILYKRMYIQFIQPHSRAKNLLIYGAGTSGIITYNALRAEGYLSSVFCAFVDDNPKLHTIRINGVKVLCPKQVTETFLMENNIEEIIISIQNISPGALNKIVEHYEDYPVKLKIVPPVNNWLNGNLQVKQIQEIRIEDLLGRKLIELGKESICREVEGKVILVTGAAGSIGSEISRQLHAYPCKQLILLDQAESALYDLQQSCGTIDKDTEVEFVIADIRNYDRIDAIFKFFRPDIVFHAAAYKHVPLMEQNPHEAITTNIKGTKHLVDAADRYGAEKFVMISTDKAVNPTNVMGATKRVAELYVNYLTKKKSKTNYVITRFGNVLGSNGSVIPLFRRQLDKGGPLTVTHPEITRYFMTIPEACQLVLEAGAMAKGGEIYVFDMGESMKIMDLAKRMIQLSGLHYPTDIDIEICGLRPGEKIYEELLADGENTQPTYHEKIMIAKVCENNIFNFADIIDKLVNLPVGLDQQEFNLELVQIIKKLVPEYKSQNSIYESLDTEEATEESKATPEKFKNIGVMRSAMVNKYSQGFEPRRNGGMTRPLSEWE